MTTIASAAFNTHADAERAVAKLREEGILETAISVVGHDHDHNHAVDLKGEHEVQHDHIVVLETEHHLNEEHTPTEDHPLTKEHEVQHDEHHLTEEHTSTEEHNRLAHADEDVDPAAVTRGVLGGGALGALIGVAILAIPGVGPIFAVGAIASAIPVAMGTGALIGAGTGGLREALIHHGIHEDHASYYEDKISKGHVLVTVNTTLANVERAHVEAMLIAAGGHNPSQNEINEIKSA